MNAKTNKDTMTKNDHWQQAVGSFRLAFLGVTIVVISHGVYAALNSYS